MHETDDAFRAMTNGEWYFDSAVTIQNGMQPALPYKRPAKS